MAARSDIYIVRREDSTAGSIDMSMHLARRAKRVGGRTKIGRRKTRLRKAFLLRCRKSRRNILSLRVMRARVFMSHTKR